MAFLRKNWEIAVLYIGSPYSMDETELIIWNALSVITIGQLSDADISWASALNELLLKKNSKEKNDEKKTFNYSWF